jgi:hypothetical protein
VTFGGEDESSELHHYWGAVSRLEKRFNFTFMDTKYKRSRFDVLCKETHSGEVFVLEMQNRYESDMIVLLWKFSSAEAGDPRGQEVSGECGPAAVYCGL